MRTRHAAAIAAALTIGLTACSSDNEPAAQPTSTPPASTATPSPSTAPSSPSASGLLAVGDAWEWETTNPDNGMTANGKTTVLSYRQPVTGIEPPGEGLGVSDRAVWSRIEVKVCNDKGDPITVSQFPWSLAYDDGAIVDVTGLSGGGFPKPEFPTDDTFVRAGRCVRGGIMFAVEPDGRPDRIVYTPEGREPVEWAVPPK
ncbi:DUF4352 domain-containing protein [Streptomyces albicerus]|uniref:hypothetical protein n=1 Tax=Streptomyces albicerus TaxID=2569859 RepID=UPI00124B18D2|nr:hypothetical protein [Streptomyces albicerus]